MNTSARWFTFLILSGWPCRFWAFMPVYIMFSWWPDQTGLDHSFVIDIHQNKSISFFSSTIWPRSCSSNLHIEIVLTVSQQMVIQPSTNHFSEIVMSIRPEENPWSWWSAWRGVFMGETLPRPPPLRRCPLKRRLTITTREDQPGPFSLGSTV